MKIIFRSAMLSLLVLMVLGVAIGQEARNVKPSNKPTDTSASGTTGTPGKSETSGTTSTGDTAATGTTATDTTGTTTTTTATVPPTPEEFFRQARQLIEEANAKPTPTKIKCSWKTETCSATDLYVNGDAISIVQISDLPTSRSDPKRKGHVAVTAGESFQDPRLSVNEKELSPLPSDISVAIHVNRSFFPTFGSSSRHFLGTADAMRDAYTVQRLQNRLDAAAAARKSINTALAAATTLETAKAVAAKKADLELITSLEAQEDFLSLVTAGQSPLLLVRVDVGTEHKTFAVGLVYQRWYFDTGGFFAFMKGRDDELVTESAADNHLKVLQRRRVGNAGTATGISFNVHPGNYPEVGMQFGLVHNNDRAPSYFLGITGRLRSIGRTALMSFAVGYAESQVKTFPGVAENETYPVDHPLLRGQNRYTARPYLAIGVSINLSGVSQGSAATPPTTTPSTSP
jgi:hypothetical protein